jgi:hypothetical protein
MPEMEPLHDWPCETLAKKLSRATAQIVLRNLIIVGPEWKANVAAKGEGEPGYLPTFSRFNMFFANRLVLHSRQSTGPDDKYWCD